MPTDFRLALCLLSLALAGCDTFDASYRTHAEAVAESQVLKGWIPEWVPSSAVALHEVHNLDSNASALTFELPPGTLLSLPPDCNAIEYRESLPVYFSRRWWPGEAQLTGEYSFFRCRPQAAPHVFVAVRHDGTRVLHWRTYAL